MAESDLRDSEETTARPEDAPPPPAENSAAATGAAASGGETSAAWRVEVNVIRSVYVARTIVLDEAPSGDFARMETATDGGARRGAYLARLAGTEPATGAPGLEGDDMLRSVYVARAVAGDAAPKPRAGRGKRRKKAAAARPRKAAMRKAKRLARPKAKKKRAAARGRRRRR